MEILSEHTCQGWLEGYLLTGRHGLFSCYEAFIHIIDSMFNQHAKWLKVTRDLDWRRDIASLNYLLTSHVWRQDHNGFSHQDPGFVDHVVNKKADVIRVYLPPDSQLPALGDRPLPAHAANTVNVVVSGKQPTPTWLAHRGRRAPLRAGHRDLGLGQQRRRRARRGAGAAPATSPRSRCWPRSSILRERLPDLRVRVVNVVDLMRLQDEAEHPHGLPDASTTPSSPPTGR